MQSLMQLCHPEKRHMNSLLMITHREYIYANVSQETVKHVAKHRTKLLLLPGLRMLASRVEV